MNTENKCGIRTLSADGERIGLIVLPQRGVGNWEERGWSNSLPVRLSAGKHTFKLDFRPEDENMNINVNQVRIYGIRITRR